MTKVDLMLLKLIPPHRVWPLLRGPYDKESSEAGKAATRDLFAYLDSHLAGKDYLVGHSITFADLLVTAILQRGSRFVVDRAFIEPYPNLYRYFMHILSQPLVVQSQGGRQPYFVDQPIDSLAIEPSQTV